MASITLRQVKGSPLTIAELDSNFTNLNTDKIERVVSVNDTASGLRITQAGTGLAFEVVTGTTSLKATQVTTFSYSGEATSTAVSAFQVAVGTTAERPTGANGKLRFNTTLGYYEGYAGAAWAPIGASTIADDTTTNATRYLTFSDQTSGVESTFNVASTKLTFNPSTGVLSATSFSGAHSGNGSALTNLNANNIDAGTLVIARGGTNSSATPTQGGVTYGTGTAYAFTAAGTTGQVLTSNGTGAPTWQAAAGGVTVVDDTTTNATRFLVFEDITSGSTTSVNVASTKLTFNPSTGQLNSVSFNSTSDFNKKKEINTSAGLSVVNALRGVEFEWRDGAGKSSGVIAQEVQAIVPHAVSENPDGLSVNYAALTAYLIEAVKELSAKVAILEAK